MTQQDQEQHRPQCERDRQVEAAARFARLGVGTSLGQSADEIAVTGARFRPTTNRLLTSSMRSASTPVDGDRRSNAGGSPAPGEPFFNSGLRMAVTVVAPGGAVRVADGDEPLQRTKPRVRLDVLDVGGPRGWCCRSVAQRAVSGNKIAVGPDLAHGSWFVRKAVLPPAV